MPTQRLDGANPRTISQFDVIGVDGDNGDFVTHVGLSSEIRNGILAGDVIALLHMQPPLEYSSEGTPADVWGTATLTVDEVKKIGLFADELMGEYETHSIRGRSQYCVMPKVDLGQSADGTAVHLQFSCATFVVEAYRRARIYFLASGNDQLPPVSLDALKIAYSEHARALEHPTIRERLLNLVGEGPWPVLLPGYVLNALDRDVWEIRQNSPYRALSGDEYFPSRRTSSETKTHLDERVIAEVRRRLPFSVGKNKSDDSPNNPPQN